MRMTSPGVGVAGVVLAAMLSVGCGYSLAGRGSFLPEHIRVIGVPTFTNQTPYFDLEQVFTDKVRSELIGRGQYTVLPESTGVDAVLTGRIRSLSLAPSSFTSDQQASRYVATVTASIELRDLSDDTVVWENSSLQFREEFDAATGASADDPRAFFDQGSNALERLSTEFARTVVGTMLEAF